MSYEVIRDPLWNNIRIDPLALRLVDTRAFIVFSDVHWAKWGSGPLLTFQKSDGRLVGGCGLIWESRTHATAGYLFGREFWGRGFASECMRAMVDFARAERAMRVSAVCHVDNGASARVLEKAGLTLEGRLPNHIVFPNLSPDPQDVLSYGLTL